MSNYLLERGLYAAMAAVLIVPELGTFFVFLGFSLGVAPLCRAIRLVADSRASLSGLWPISWGKLPACPTSVDKATPAALAGSLCHEEGRSVPVPCDSSPPPTTEFRSLDGRVIMHRIGIC